MSQNYEIQTVSRSTRVPVATLNVWINRGVIAAPATTRGKARAFDRPTILAISLVRTLVSLNQPPGIARAAAYLARPIFDRPGAKLLIGPPRQTTGVPPERIMFSAPTITPIEAPKPVDFERALARFKDGRPEGLIVVDLNEIARRVDHELTAFRGVREPSSEHEAAIDALMKSRYGDEPAARGTKRQKNRNPNK